MQAASYRSHQCLLHVNEQKLYFLSASSSRLRGIQNQTPCSSPVRRVKSNNREKDVIRTCRLKVSAVSVENSPSKATTTSDVEDFPPMITVNVNLADRTYPIYIGAGLLEQGELLTKHIRGKKVLIVTNETVAPLYLERTVRSIRAASQAAGTEIVIESVVLPDGENFKNMETLMMIFDAALKLRLDRKCTFVALGGGVIGDMCGFAAASYLRGVQFIQIPTTVMSQVDSSVGGKTGVNHPLGKNMIGAFYQPQCVLIDTNTLRTLPDRELCSGFSEIIKYGLIRDASLFEWLEENIERLKSRDPSALAYAIERSCLIKAQVVSEDEREGDKGVRATLNLGHTFGHAIENGIGYGEWLHGEAVAAGTVMAADLSLRLGWVSPALVERTLSLIEKADLPTVPPKEVNKGMFKSLMAVDKKVSDGQLRLILLKGELGNCVFTSEFDPLKLEETLDRFTNLAPSSA